MKGTTRAALLTAAVFTVTLLAGCASAPQRPTQIARNDYATVGQYLTQAIRHRMKQRDITGLSIALVDDQKIVWAEGFGYADQVRGIAATPATTYRVGSITKLFTATAAMQMAQQGRFDIDKPLTTYLPQYAMHSRFGATPPVTPRMLMTHHSGLPGDLLHGMWNAHPQPFTTIIDELKDDYVAYPPNFILAYSNLGVTLLGHAIGQAAGEDYSAYLRRTLLQPLGMTHSVLSMASEGPAMSKGYRKGVETVEPPLRDVPAGGLNSSVVDLSQFLEMVFAEGSHGGQQILTPATLAEMLRRQNAGVPLDGDLSVGLGWMLNPIKGWKPSETGPVARHNGATLLFHSALVALPRHKIGVIVLANSESAGGIVDEIADEALKVALEAKSGVASGAADHAPVAAAVPVTPVFVQAPQALVGVYATPIGLATIARDGNALRAEAIGKRFEVVPRADGYFGVQYRVLGLVPISLPGLTSMGLSSSHLSGRDVLLAHVEGRRIVVGERVAPLPISTAWLDRLGEYTVVNGEGEALVASKIALRNRNGFVTLEFAVPQLGGELTQIALRPVSDTESVVLGLGRNLGETIRVVKMDGHERLLYSGYVLKKTN